MTDIQILNQLLKDEHLSEMELKRANELVYLTNMKVRRRMKEILKGGEY